MSGTQFGQFILGLIVVAIVIAIAVWLLHWLYLRSSKERAFVRTGFGGQKVVMNGGAFVLPIVHEVIPVNMNTLRLEVSRGRDKALITKDRMRVDVVSEFYVRVQAAEEAISAAAQTLGQRTMQPETLKELVEGKFVDALRTVAAEMTMEELHEKRGEYVKRVRAVVAADLLQNGLELETVSLTQLDQTAMEFFNPSNAFDAEGLTKLTETIESRGVHVNQVSGNRKFVGILRFNQDIRGDRFLLFLARLLTLPRPGVLLLIRGGRFPPGLGEHRNRLACVRQKRERDDEKR